MQTEEDRSHADEANSSHPKGIHDNNAQTASLTDMSGDRPEMQPPPPEEPQAMDLEPFLLRLGEDSPLSEPIEEVSEQPARKVYTPPNKKAFSRLSPPRMLTSCLAAAIRLRLSLLGSTPGESTLATNRARRGSGGSSP